ncbi:MAG: hypothetical protein K2X43_10935 [Hyphomonadaceae bacterium]|jgi:hypothetical protein|nr:hypothetical protein [Hyphomonadaceae bacterium]
MNLGITQAQAASSPSTCITAISTCRLRGGCDYADVGFGMASDDVMRRAGRKPSAAADEKSVRA